MEQGMRIFMRGRSQFAAALLVAAMLWTRRTAAIGAYPCENMAELILHTEALNNACCEEAGDDCTSGVPQACDLECAAELLPFRNACKEVLQSSLGIVLRPLINEAAARCPGAPTSAIFMWRSRAAAPASRRRSWRTPSPSRGPAVWNV